jgi:hypothetical protein
MLTMSAIESKRTGPKAIDNGPAALSIVHLQRLAALERPAMQQLWRALLGGRSPARMSRPFLIYCLAYRLQEQAYGGLSSASRAKLLEIAHQLDSPAALRRGVRLTPGTRLIRQWRAQRHEVIVLEHGFAYRGSHYGSLSEIARMICGGHCSGPRFFGVSSKSASAAASKR